MRRPILIFLAAVLLPGLVLGGLALQSIRHQEALLEHQRSRVLEGLAQRVAQAIAARLDEHQRDFSLRVESLLAREAPDILARQFDDRIREHWPLAQLGFAVALSGGLLSPQILGSPEARQFLVRNDDFLCNRSSVEIFAVTQKGRIDLATLDPPAVPSNAYAPQPTAARQRFVQFIGDAQEGILSRFIDDQLAIWTWYRTSRQPDLVYGAQISIARLQQDLGDLLQATPRPGPGVVLALIDERGHAIRISPPEAPPIEWNRAFSSAAIGSSLPNWRVAAVAADPLLAHRDSWRLQVTLGAVVVLLVAALAVGGWIVATDARRQLEAARRKSDFVSNVSHELRTPLTSIQLFAEMLEEDRVTDPVKRRNYLGIIRAEAGRLHRLIGNILDFARHERAGAAPAKEQLDLSNLVRSVLATFEPQFQADAMSVGVEFPEAPVWVWGDRDGLAQLINNLLSNASKYAASGGEITLRTRTDGDRAILEVLDRGPGVPAGCSERIFEAFFRADDALSSGVPGAGLGLTLARRIAQSHGGGLSCHSRDGGGACFRADFPAAPVPSLPS